MAYLIWSSLGGPRCSGFALTRLCLLGKHFAHSTSAVIPRDRSSSSEPPPRFPECSHFRWWGDNHVPCQSCGSSEGTGVCSQDSRGGGCKEWTEVEWEEHNKAAVARDYKTKAAAAARKKSQAIDDSVELHAPAEDLSSSSSTKKSKKEEHVSRKEDLPKQKSSSTRPAAPSDPVSQGSHESRFHRRIGAGAPSSVNLSSGMSGRDSARQSSELSRREERLHLSRHDKRDESRPRNVSARTSGKIDRLASREDSGRSRKKCDESTRSEDSSKSKFQEVWVIQAGWLGQDSGRVVQAGRLV